MHNIQAAYTQDGRWSLVEGTIIDIDGRRNFNNADYVILEDTTGNKEMFALHKNISGEQPVVGAHVILIHEEHRFYWRTVLEGNPIVQDIRRYNDQL